MGFSVLDQQQVKLFAVVVVLVLALALVLVLLVIMLLGRDLIFEVWSGSSLWFPGHVPPRGIWLPIESALPDVCIFLWSPF